MENRYAIVDDVCRLFVDLQMLINYFQDIFICWPNECGVWTLLKQSNRFIFGLLRACFNGAARPFLVIKIIYIYTNTCNARHVFNVYISMWGTFARTIFTIIWFIGHRKFSFFFILFYFSLDKNLWFYDRVVSISKSFSRAALIGVSIIISASF